MELLENSNHVMIEKHRDERVSAQLIKQPSKLLAPDNCPSDNIPEIEDLGLTARALQYRPMPYEKVFLPHYFHSLMNEVVATKGMSSPITGQTMCSNIAISCSILHQCQS